MLDGETTSQKLIAPQCGIIMTVPSLVLNDISFRETNIDGVKFLVASATFGHFKATKKPNEYFWWIEELFVKHDFRGRGFGKKLVSKFPLPCRLTALATPGEFDMNFLSQRKLEAFYERQGFVAFYKNGVLIFQRET